MDTPQLEQEPDKGLRRFLPLIGAIIGFIALAIIVILIIDKYGPDFSNEASNQNKGVDNVVVKPSAQKVPTLNPGPERAKENILALARRVLKPEFVPTNLSLQSVPHSKEQYIGYSQVLQVDGMPFTFLAEDGDSGSRLGEYIFGDSLNNKDNSFETVIDLLSKTFILPSTEKEKWVTKDYSNGLVGYEYKTITPESIDSIIAYATKVKNGTVTIREGACHIMAVAPEYKKGGCLVN